MKLMRLLLILPAFVLINSCEMFTLLKQEGRLKLLLENQQVLHDFNFVNNAGWNSSGFFTTSGTLNSNGSGLVLDNGSMFKTSSIGVGQKVCVEIELGNVGADYYPGFYVKPAGSGGFTINSVTDYAAIYTASSYAANNGWIIRYKDPNAWEAVDKTPFTGNMVIHLVMTSSQMIIYKNYQETAVIPFTDLKPFYFDAVTPTPIGSGTYQFSGGFFLSIVGYGTSGAAVKRMKIYQLK